MLDAAMREIVLEAVRQALREEVTPLLERLERAGQPEPVRYISTDEAANIAGVKASTIREWINNGQLVAHRAGRLLRIKLDDLEAFLAEEKYGRISDKELEQRAACIVAGRRNRW